MKIKLKQGSDIFEFNGTRNGADVQIKFKDKDLKFTVQEIQPAKYLLCTDSRRIPVYAVRDKDKIFIQVNEQTWVFDDVSQQDDAMLAAGGGDLQVISPMPGSVIKVLVNVGDVVKRNQTLVVVEAMKMENEVRASMDAVVEKILVKTGQQVGGGEELVKLVLPETPD